MKILGRNDNVKYHVYPGDTLIISAIDIHGVKEKILEEPIKEEMNIDTVMAIQLEKKELNQLGLKKGIAGIFGERK